MRPRILTSILLFVSAYSPLFIILAAKDFDFNAFTLKHPWPFSVLILLSLLSVLLLFVAFRKMPQGSKLIKVHSVRDRSVDIINYTIPYMISFFGVDLDKPGDVIAVIVFLAILLLLTVTSRSVFLNPILALAGYQLFDIDYSFDSRRHSTVVLSKIEVHKGRSYRILALTRFLYLVTSEGGSSTHAE